MVIQNASETGAFSKLDYSFPDGAVVLSSLLLRRIRSILEIAQRNAIGSQPYRRRSRPNRAASVAALGLKSSPHQQKEAGTDASLFLSRLRECLCGLIDGPLAQDLGGTFLADLDHASQTLLRTFLDSTVEAALIISHTKHVVGRVKAEV